ncbi:MAG: response regulator [Prolixibacteraceae bacterium]
MKKIAFSNIRNALTFWFLILALGPLIVAIVITYNVSSTAFEQRTFDKLTAIRDLKVSQVENWIIERTGDFITFTQNTDPKLLNDAITTPDSESTNKVLEQKIREILHNYQKAYLVYEEIFIINTKTGLVDISTNSANEGRNKKGESYYSEAIRTDKLYISPIYYSSEARKNLLTFSTPLYNDWNLKPGIIGILVANIDLNKSLYPLLLNRTGLGNTGETLIVDKDVMALNELSGYQNAPLHLQINAEPAIYASQGKTGIIKSTDYRNVEVLAAYTYIPKTGWGFVCKQDLAELNQPIKKMGNVLVLLLLFSGLAVMFIVYFVSRSISKPIVNMNLIAQKVKAGDFSVRNSINSNNELGTLAAEFNNMISITESRIKTLNGVSAISKTMVDKTNMHDFALSLIKQLMKITGANISAFYVLNDGSMEYEHFLSIGTNAETLKSFNAENPEGNFGNVLIDKSIHVLRNIPDNTIFNYRTFAGEAIPKEIVTIPLLIDNTVVAIISLAGIRPFKSDSLEIIKQSWNNMNATYTSLISSERTRIFAELLSQTNQQLEAQAEELQAQSEELKSQSEELQQTANELLEQNLELDLQKEQVETANQLKTEFLSNMSHELRTPLNSIMALSRVLIMQANDKLDEEENNYLEIIERNGKRLLALINDILDLSKIEAGKMDISPEFISVANLLSIIKDSIQSLADEKGLQLTLSLPDNLPKVETDESKLHQVLLNIVGNAVKFTEQGSVVITAKYDQLNLFIEVKDSGVGISAEDLHYIFEEFRQADGSTSRRFEGTGLGLAIAQKLTGILGGTIEVMSQSGVGTTFVISIPINWSGSPVRSTLTETGTGREVPGQFPKPGSKENFEYIAQQNDSETMPKNLKGKDETRILMVEDNPEAVIQIKKILEGENYRVDVAPGGRAALDYIQHTIPDGIILDLMMPHINGFEVLNRIRNTVRTKNIPVLILSAKDLTKEELAELTSNNIQQLVQKGNIDIETLRLKVNSMLGKNDQFAPNSQASKKKNDSFIQHEQKIEIRQEYSAKNLLPELLILEDNSDNLTTIKAILKGKFNLNIAFSGDEAIRMASENPFQLILFDLSLPVSHSQKVIRWLKSNEKTSQIPIIVLTAQAMKGDQEKFLKLGFNGYVSKPINQEELFTEIQKLLNDKII